MNFSFAGCGFLGIYHVGVAACLKKYAPNLIINKIAGASAGALAAVLLLCDCPLGTITSSVLKTATEARKRSLGPFSPTFNIEKLLREGLLSVLPPDAHKRVSGKLYISVTRVSDGKNILLSNFETYDELVQAILASAFIPVFSGWLPKLFRGVAYLDGAFSDNLPILDDYTVTVSPFKGDSDICPDDNSPSFMQALLCSAFIPAFSGWGALKIKGVRYVDGGFSDNLPQLDENTVTVSPFCGEADICPKDMNAGIMTISLANTSIELSRENLYRFSMILFPPPPEILNRMCQQGFNDTLDFLQRNYLINCTRCLAVHSTINLEDKKEESQTEIAIDFDESCETCEDCQIQRQEAILDTLPEAVGSILQDAIDVANKGLMNWVFKHKSMKLASILSLPYILPVEVAYASFIKFMDIAPSVKDWKILATRVVEVMTVLLKSYLRKSVPSAPHQHLPRHHHDNKFSCQIAITEFTGEDERAAMAVENRNKFNFVIDLDDADSASQTRRESLSLESEALNQLALRCAARSLSAMAAKGASRSPSRVASRNPSRAVSRAVSRHPSSENISNSDWDVSFPHHVPDDAFDQVLEVTSHQDAVMAYYYMDDNNEMRVTEIFDMSQDMVDADIRQMENINRLHPNQVISRAALQSHLESFNGLAVSDDKYKQLDDLHGSSLNLNETLSEPEADQAY